MGKLLEMKTIVSTVAGGLVTALMLMTSGVLWSWMTDGTLVELLGGARQQDVAEHVHPITHPEIQVGLFSVSSPAISTDPGSMRSVTGRVPFPQVFSSTPFVTLSMNSLDTERAANTRITLEVRDITREYFEYSVNTWLDSIVYSVGVSWLAIAPPAPAPVLNPENAP